MSKCFRPGLKYVFTKKKFINSSRCNKTEYQTDMLIKQWVDLLNGCEVEVVHKGEGEIFMRKLQFPYFVVPKWCKCIGDSDD